MNYFKRLREVAISVALLVIPFFFLSANLKDPSRATVVDSETSSIDAPPGSAVQIVSSRGSSAETDGHAKTIVASTPEDESTPAPALTQFSTSQIESESESAAPARRVSLGPVIGVAMFALVLGLIAGFLVLGRSDRDDDQASAPLPAPLPTRTGSQRLFCTAASALPGTAPCFK